MPTARELANTVAALSDKDARVAAMAVPHPAEVQARLLASSIRIEAALGDLRDLLTEIRDRLPEPDAPKRGKGA